MRAARSAAVLAAHRAPEARHRHPARYIRAVRGARRRTCPRQGYDGVVCGHIHRANLREIGGTLYANTGDWVESCSALTENRGGAADAAALAAALSDPAATRRAAAGGRRVRIALASDAWTPQTNGVVTTLKATAATLDRPRTRSAGHLARRACAAFLPELPGDPPRAVRRAPRGAGAEGLPPARDPHRHRGPARGLRCAVIAGARACPSRAPITRATRSTCAPAGRFPSASATPGCGASTAPPRAPSSAAPACAAELVRARLSAACICGAAAWTCGASARADQHPQLAGLPRPIMVYVGPPRGGEEPRGLPAPRAAGYQGADRRRAGCARARRPLPAGALSPATASGRSSRAVLARRRRAGISEPDRHLRPRHDRGARLRCAGGGLPGAGAAGRDRAGGDRVSCTTTSPGDRRRAAPRAAACARRAPRFQLGGGHCAVSGRSCADPAGAARDAGRQPQFGYDRAYWPRAGSRAEAGDAN